MINNLLKAHLKPVVHRRSRVRFWRKLALCWAGAACLGLGLLALEDLGGWTSSLALPLVAVLGITAALIVVARHNRVEPDWRAIATKIEATHPELDGRLLTAVQQPGQDSSELNYLQDRLVREAALHSLRNDWAAVIPKHRLALTHMGHLLALVLFIITLSGLRVPGGGGALFARKTGAGITVTPGDTSIERGNSLVVLARFGGSLPANVELVFGPSPETTRRIPLVKSLADPVFGGSVPEVASNLVYHVEYAGQRTPDFKVTVFEFPRLERADADLTFPDYTGQGPKHIENTRRVSAVEGSQLGLTLQFNKPVTSARLVDRSKVDARNAIALLVETNLPIARLDRFPLESSRTYDLQLVDAEGRTNKVPSQFVFAVLTNRTPELKVASPRGDTRPSALEEIAFEGTVWDDFGVGNYGLAFTLVGEETKFIELGKTVPAKEKRTFQYLLRLEDLGVEPDQLIAWYVWADDVGPDGEVRRAPGDMYLAEVRPFEEIFREGQGGGQQEQQGGQQGGQQGSQAARLLDLQKQIISATWRLQRQHGGAKKPAAAPPAKPAEKQSSMDAGFRSADLQSAVSPILNRRSGIAEAATLYRAVPQFAGQRAPGSGGVQRGPRSNRGAQNPDLNSSSSTATYAEDIVVVRDAESQAIEQARTALANQQDPRSAALWETAVKRMEQALEKLTAAADSPASLPGALIEQQAAYDALLKAREREFQVSRSRRGGQQGGGSQQQQRQMQLDQMDLTDAENRYETQRQAQSPQSPERREQLQVMNRLQELARRQQDLNDRLRELQTALQEARTDPEREEIRRQLKRLQEEEQQMLADVDELRQRMDRPENQSQMAEERQQLDRTREDVQRASEAAAQGQTSQALASGTRAQRQLQELRDQMRRENSSQFAEDLRDMRAEARELARRQEDLVNRMEQQANSERKTLTDSGERQQMLDQVARQRERMTNLVERATQVSQDAESSEPLLSRQLYDSVRKFSQDTGRDLKDVQDKLLNAGLLTRNLADQLQRTSEQDGAKLMDITSEMLRLDFLPPATDAGRRARSGINDLARGVERAAESVLGDNTEALRLAQQQLDQLTEQLQREIAREQRGGTNRAPGAGSAEGRQGDQQDQSGGGQLAQNDAAQQGSGRQGEANSGNQGQDPANGEQQNSSQQGRGGRRGGQRSGNQDGAQPGESGQTSQAQANQEATSGQQGEEQTGGQGQGQRGGDQPGQRGSNQQLAQNGQNGQQGQAQDGQPQDGQPQDGQPGNTPGNAGQRNAGQRNGGRRGGGQLSGGPNDGERGGGRFSNVFDQVLNRGSDGGWTGPITGEEFVNWSDGLRNVEEMIEIPELRNEVARARERARVLRQEFRAGQKPDWTVVRLQVEKPLVEVRDRVAEELARRGSEQALVPIDRDPVPNRYSDLVRRYYEELGKDK